MNVLRKILIIICLGFVLVIHNCQKKESNNVKINNNANMMFENNRLIDNVDLKQSIFEAEDIELKKYKYNGDYIENIYIKNLLDDNYRSDFF